MTQIRIKRVYEPATPDDGIRVLVDKLWPRGMRRDALQMDLWERRIAPSDALRRWYHAAPEERWEEFRQKYTGELESSPAVGEFMRTIADHPVATLLYGSKNAAQNHALILRDYLHGACSSSGLTAG